MRGPLSLVIDDGNGERHVTRRTRGLRYKKSAYGGDVDATCTLNLPRNFFTDLGPGSTVNVLDGRTGGFVWRGSGSQPGVTAGPRGEMWDLQAFGGAERLQAATKPVAYVHALDEDWPRNGGNSTRNAQTTQDQRNDGTATFEVYFDKDKDVDAGDAGAFINRAFQQARLKLARVRADVDAGVTTSNYVMRLMAGTDAASLSSAASRDANTTAGTLVATLGSGLSVGDDLVELRAIRAAGSGTETVPDKSRWFRFLDVIACQMLKDKYGANITTGYGTNTILAHEVIRDMIGRHMIPGLDPDKTTIGTFDYAIDALSYLDGIMAADLLQALRVFEPKLTWQVYGDEGNFDVWPEDPRYVISSRDGGVTQPGDDAATEANYVLVEYLDRRGRQQTEPVYSAPEADPDDPDYDPDAVRQIETISLPDGTGSVANAQRAGLKALELASNPPKAGTAVIRRRIMDLWTGALVLPHEVQPACLAVVQETGDLLRVTETDYSDDDAAVVLTLGEPRKPLEAVIADLERKQRRHRK